MILYRVSDCDFGEFKKSKYDLVLFCSGYEERCTHIPCLLEGVGLSNAVIWGFKEVMEDKQREHNDKYFRKHWKEPTLLGGGEDEPAFRLLRSIFKTPRVDARILIDYSSMSRLWYTALLNWARFFSGSGNITIDFLYAVGDHKSPMAPMVISEILSLPGCEGVPFPLSKSVAIIGLGFEGPAALCVLDRLEPDNLFCYLAKPAAFPDYPKRVRQKNREVINQARACLELPLSSVELCFRTLGELISPYRSEANITLVPMGPKPHVLASILMAMRFEQISCLRVAYRRHQPERVSTTGQIVATRVEFIGRPRLRMDLPGMPH